MFPYNNRYTNIAALMGGSTTLILDAFTDTDTTLLSAHTIAPINIPATAWVNSNGAWTISSNAAFPPTGGNTNSNVNAGVADASISADITFPNASSYAIGIIGRFQDSSNYWICAGERDASGTPYVVIFERNAGVNTSRATSNQTLTNTTKNLKLVLSGTTLTGYLDGVQVVTFSSSSFQTNTKHGVWSFEGGGYTRGSIDNFTVTIP